MYNPIESSIQPSQRENERTVGAIIGKMKPKSKSKSHPKDKIKLYLHPSSIPTKFRTVHYDDNEERGFNSTTRRFELKQNELPGPGYYAQPIDVPLETCSSPSISKKGYGVGFASKTYRFHGRDIETFGSPSQYHPTEPIYCKSQMSLPSPVFRLPIASESCLGSNGFVRDRWGIKATPGPSSYNPHVTDSSSKWKGSTESGASFVFKSRTRRDLRTSMIDLPPPGAYDYDQALTKRVSGAQAAFKATWRSVESKLQDTTPAPGSYEITGSPHLKRNISKRPKVASISSYVGKVQDQKEESPGPGNYEVAKASDKVCKSAPITKIQSSLPRFKEKIDTTSPGPGYYKSLKGDKFKSFHLNIESIWLS